MWKTGVYMAHTYANLNFHKYEQNKYLYMKTYICVFYSMWIFTYVYLHVEYSRMHLCLCTTEMCIHIFIYIYATTCAIYTGLIVCKYVCINYMSVCLSVCMHACMYVCVCVPFVCLHMKSYMCVQKCGGSELFWYTYVFRCACQDLKILANR